MPITARRRGRFLLLLVILACLAGPLGGQSEEPWLPFIAQLASLMSRNDAAGTLALFDRGMKEYGTIEANLEAMAAQTDVLCAIDVVEGKDQGGIYLLDVDWYVRITSKADGGPTERRRQRVQVLIKRFQGKLEIVSISPVDILDPLHIN